MGRKSLLGVLSFAILFGLGMGCNVVVQPGPEARPPSPPHYPSPPPPQPPDPYPREIYGDATLFYADLSPYGEWVWIEAYGWVWDPYDVRADWRPYTYGRWAYTDYGWMWVSDWEWGWIPFHYGRWAFVARYGWVWVPGREWAPAWVAWRYGNGWIGWAPLPPGVDWRVGVYVERSIGPSSWCFIEDHLFLGPNIRINVALSARNITLVRVTQNVTKYTVIQNRIVDRSLTVEQIERATRQPVSRSRVVYVDSPKAAHGPRARGDEVVVYQPDLSKRAPGRIPSRPESGPRITTPPEREILQRQEGERRQQEEEQTMKRRRLEEDQRRELERSPRGISAQELRRQHDNERRTFEEQVQQEKEILQYRHERERKGELKGKGPREK